MAAREVMPWSPDSRPSSGIVLLKVCVDSGVGISLSCSDAGICSYQLLFLLGLDLQVGNIC